MTDDPRRGLLEIHVSIQGFGEDVPFYGWGIYVRDTPEVLDVAKDATKALIERLAPFVK